MGPDDIGPSPDGIEYTDFSSDIDIVGVHGRPARHIEVIDAGAGTKLVALVIAGSGGATRTLTTYDHWARPYQITRIKNTTTVAKLQISW